MTGYYLSLTDQEVSKTFLLEHSFERGGWQWRVLRHPAQGGNVVLQRFYSDAWHNQTNLVEVTVGRFKEMRSGVPGYRTVEEAIADAERRLKPMIIDGEEMPF